MNNPDKQFNEDVMTYAHYSLQNSALTTLNRQQGAVLIVSLIILLVLTLIGITGMRTTVLEEKMAGNMNDQNLAFQAAEAALRDGEDLMNTLVTNASFNGTAGRLAATDTDPDWFNEATWSNTNSIAYSGTLDYVKTQPRYVLKYISAVTNTKGSLKTGGYGSHRSSTVDQFRVTARGTGKSDTSKVILEAYFGKNM